MTHRRSRLHWNSELLLARVAEEFRRERVFASEDKIQEIHTQYVSRDRHSSLALTQTNPLKAKIPKGVSPEKATFALNGKEGVARIARARVGNQPISYGSQGLHCSLQ